MAETSTVAVEVKVDSKNAEKSVGSIKSRLKEARTELTNAIENFGEFSQEAANAAKNVEGLKGTIDDASRLVAAFDGDRKFQAFGQSISAVASGFSAAQGAIGLFGTESKEVEQALLKVNSAMALSQGVNGVLEGVKSFKDLGLVIKSTTVFQKASAAATAIAATAQKLFTKSVDESSKGFKSLRGAIIATGIGALVVLVGLLIENFDSVKKVIEKLIGPLKNITDFFGKLINSFTDFIGLTSEASREADKLKKATEKNNVAFNNQIEIMQAQGATSKEIRAIKNQMYEDELNNLRQVLALQGTLSKEEADRFKELKQQQAVLRAEQGKEDKDAAAAEAAKKAEAANKAAEAARQRAAAAAAERKRERERIAAEQAKALEDEIKKNEEIKLKRIADTRAFVKAERQAVDEELEKSAELSQERLVNRVTKSIELRVKDNEDAKQKADEQKALDDAVYQNKINLLAGVSSALSAASDVVGRETAAGKALAVSASLINTYTAITGQLKAFSGVPVPGYAIAQAIATGLAGFAAVRNILKTKVPAKSGGGSSAGVSVPTTITAPVPPQAETTTLNQGQINQIGNAAGRAFVVESDITGNQEKIRRLNRQARIN
jgi:chromosome segregation ATPase